MQWANAIWNFICKQNFGILSIYILGCTHCILTLLVRKYSHNLNHISAHVWVKWPLTPLSKMIYESASPPGPALPLQFSSCICAHYIDTFRILIYPKLQIHRMVYLSHICCSMLCTNINVCLQEFKRFMLSEPELSEILNLALFTIDKCWAHSWKKSNTAILVWWVRLCDSSVLLITPPYSKPPASQRCPLPSQRTRVPPLFSLSRVGVWGKQSRFSCANVSQSAPSNHRPVFSRDRGLRHSLNNLAALCHRALGSQPSKVMTEKRSPTSPPIHSHYHLFTVHDSRQTKQKASREAKIIRTV